LKTYILTTSPGFISRSGSLFSGEKWQIQLLTDMHVGNAMPEKLIQFSGAQNVAMARQYFKHYKQGR